MNKKLFFLNSYRAFIALCVLLSLFLFLAFPNQQVVERKSTIPREEGIVFLKKEHICPSVQGNIIGHSSIFFPESGILKILPELDDSGDSSNSVFIGTGKFLHFIQKHSSLEGIVINEENTTRMTKKFNLPSRSSKVLHVTSGESATVKELLYVTKKSRRLLWSTLGQSNNSSDLRKRYYLFGSSRAMPFAFVSGRSIQTRSAYLRYFRASRAPYLMYRNHRKKTARRVRLNKVEKLHASTPPISFTNNQGRALLLFVNEEGTAGTLVTARGRVIHTFQFSQPGQLVVGDFLSGNSKTLAHISQEGRTLTLYDLDEGKERAIIEGQFEGYVSNQLVHKGSLKRLKKWCPPVETLLTPSATPLPSVTPISLATPTITETPSTPPIKPTATASFTPKDAPYAEGPYPTRVRGQSYFFGSRTAEAGPSNFSLTSHWLSYRFRAERDGSIVSFTLPLTYSSGYNSEKKSWPVVSPGNYSSGDGGVIRVGIRQDSNGEPLNAFALNNTAFTDIRILDWATGRTPLPPGGRDITKHGTNFPTVTLKTPVPVRKGEYYHLYFKNVAQDASSNFASVNASMQPGADTLLRDIDSAINPTTIHSNNSRWEGKGFNPVFLISIDTNSDGSADSFVGNPWFDIVGSESKESYPGWETIGTGFSSIPSDYSSGWLQLSIGKQNGSGGRSAAQIVIPLPEKGVNVETTSSYFNDAMILEELYLYFASIGSENGTLEVRLKDSSGATLASQSIPARSFGNKLTSKTGYGSGSWVQVAFPYDRLGAGKKYYLQFFGKDGGIFVSYPVRRNTNYFPEHGQYIDPSLLHYTMDAVGAPESFSPTSDRWRSTTNVLLPFAIKFTQG